jgi:hypothetical protein
MPRSGRSRWSTGTTRTPTSRGSCSFPLGAYRPDDLIKPRSRQLHRGVDLVIEEIDRIGTVALIHNSLADPPSVRIDLAARGRRTKPVTRTRSAGHRAAASLAL